MDYKSHFLDYDKTIFFKQRIAKALGVCEALIVQHINYHAETNNNIHYGHRWFYHTIKNFQITFPFYSERTIRRAIDSLEKMGILITGKFSRLKTDRTKWYRIDAEELDAIVYKRTPGYLEEMRNANMQNANGQNDLMEDCQNCQDDHNQLDRMTTSSFKDKYKDNKNTHTNPHQDSQKITIYGKGLNGCDQKKIEEDNHTLSAPKENQLEQNNQDKVSGTEETKINIKGTGITSNDTKNEFSDDFLKFYLSYPKKISKGDAWKAWKQVLKKLPQIDELLLILEKHKAQEGWKNPQYIPYPASWLRGLKWDDELEITPMPKSLFPQANKKVQEQGNLFDQLINKSKEVAGGKD